MSLAAAAPEGDANAKMRRNDSGTFDWDTQPACPIKDTTIWLSGPAGSQSSNLSVSPLVMSPMHSPRARSTRLARRDGLMRVAAPRFVELSRSVSDPTAHARSKDPTDVRSE